MYDAMITNKNEITKGEFDELNEINDFDQFSREQVTQEFLGLAALIKKAESEEISDDEVDIIKSTTAELKSLTKYTINEKVDGRIVKSDVYVMPKQVKWFDDLEKSETGETIEKGIFLDTDLNRELERVGLVFEKGKKAVKKEVKKEDEEKYDDDMYKAAMAYVKNGKMEKGEMYKGMNEKYPEGDKEMMKKCLNKAYKDMADDYMKKADDEIEIGDDDDEDDKKEEKGKKKSLVHKSILNDLGFNDDLLVKAKYISRKKVGGKWVYDYGDKKDSGKGKKVESEDVKPKVGQTVTLEGKGEMEVRAVRENEIVLAKPGEEKASLSISPDRFKKLLEKDKKDSDLSTIEIKQKLQDLSRQGAGDKVLKEQLKYEKLLTQKEK